MTSTQIVDVLDPSNLGSGAQTYSFVEHSDVSVLMRLYNSVAISDVSVSLIPVCGPDRHSRFFCALTPTSFVPDATLPMALNLHPNTEVRVLNYTSTAQRISLSTLGPMSGVLKPLSFDHVPFQLAWSWNNSHITRAFHAYVHFTVTIQGSGVGIPLFTPAQLSLQLTVPVETEADD